MAKINQRSPSSSISALQDALVKMSIKEVDKPNLRPNLKSAKKGEKKTRSAQHKVRFANDSDTDDSSADGDYESVAFSSPSAKRAYYSDLLDMRNPSSRRAARRHSQELDDAEIGRAQIFKEYCSQSLTPACTTSILPPVEDVLPPRHSFPRFVPLPEVPEAGELIIPESTLGWQTPADADNAGNAPVQSTSSVCYCTLLDCPFGSPWSLDSRPLDSRPPLNSLGLDNSLHNLLSAGTGALSPLLW